MRPGHAGELAVLVAGCAGRDGVHPFGRDLGPEEIPEAGGPRRVLVAEAEGGVAGAALLDFARLGVDLRLAVAPGHRRRGAGTALVASALDAAREAGSDCVGAWAYVSSPAVERLSFRTGFALGRRLLRLEMPIAEIGASPPPSGYEIGTFSEDDAAAVLAVNNAAFAWHPGQGGLTPDEFRRRTGQPWVDRAGFFVARAPGGVAGFCWTRLHQVVPPLGEIHVICVHPDHAGSGLGSALVLTGLAYLAQRAATGMLYVDELNLGARGLYGGLGFHLAAVDTCYIRDLTGALDNAPRAGVV